jgi:hypothetical protein
MYTISNNSKFQQKLSPKFTTLRKKGLFGSKTNKIQKKNEEKKIYGPRAGAIRLDGRWTLTTCCGSRFITAE